jgi:hypothetical protein
MNMDESTKSLLLIGASSTGKTHYGGQILGRLRQGSGELKMRKAADNISLFEEVLNCLGQGMPAGHTSVKIYDNIILPLEIPGGVQMDLVWPDYGGEQIKLIMDARQIGKKWRRRIIESDGWIFFIRLDHITAYEDISSRPWKEMEKDCTCKESSEFKWSSQAYFIELLQFFLHAKGVGTTNRLKLPAICFILSCWDEIKDIKEGIRPAELLQERMPLLANFTRATWEKDYFHIFGLSSLGRDLNKNEPDEEYIERGPETQGYVVSTEGEYSPDLTLPICTLIKFLM